MKPLASAPRIRSGCRGPANSASCSTVSCSASASARSGMMSLKTIPRLGKSGMSRIFDVRSTDTSGPHEGANCPPEEELRELLRKRRKCLEVFEAGAVAVRIMRAELRRDDLLELRRLLFCSGLERAQVPRLDAVAGELETRRDYFHVALRVPPLTAFHRRIEQPVVLEVAHEGRRRAGPLAERLEVELLLWLAETHARPWLAPRHRELLPDDAKGQ